MLAFLGVKGYKQLVEQSCTSRRPCHPATAYDEFAGKARAGSRSGVCSVTGRPCAELLPGTMQPYSRKEFTMEEQVLKAMKEAGKPVRPGDIAKALGVDSKEVSKACAELKKAGKIYSPKRCYYEPVAE